MEPQNQNSTYEVKRLSEILGILFRHGFGDVLHKLDLDKTMFLAEKFLHQNVDPKIQLLTTPQRLRMAFEEMGPTFVKLGQILATRVDLFKPDWIAEFEKLQDHAAPVSSNLIVAQLEEDLGGALSAVFAGFEEQPMACASIAQVHRAVLRTGEHVIVKVQRPGIKSIVEVDLRLMSRLAGLIENQSEDLRRFRPREIVRQFSRTMKDELDFTTECRNAETIANNLKDNTSIVVPKVYWSYTGERVNVQEIISGIPGRDFHMAETMGLDRKVLAKVGANAVLKMILEDGFFHADLHPGNVFYLPQNKVALIDFGMVGHLSERRKQQIIRIILGLVTKNTDQISLVLEDWAVGVSIDRESLLSDIENLVIRYNVGSFKSLKLSELFRDLIDLVHRHHLVLPPDLPVLVRALVPLENLAMGLDPEFDMMGAIMPFLERTLLNKFSLRNLSMKAFDFLLTNAHMFSEVPKELRYLLRDAQEGGIKFKVNVDDLSLLTSRLDRAASRLSIAAVISALIIGSGIVMTVNSGPKVLGLPFLGFLGFVSSIVGGIWLLYSIWKGR